MKIIDILNKMANGTLEDGFKFAYEDVIYKYDKSRNTITNTNNGELGNRYRLEKCLNDEVLLFKENDVEVIEENKGIEELPVYPSYAYRKEELSENRLKINELVRAVNKLTKEREAN